MRLSAHRLLRPAEERELTILAAAGDQPARQRLIESNLRLVVSIAKRYTGYGLDLDDLVGHGTVGLITAIDRFEPERGLKLSTYATYRILKDIRDAVRAHRAIAIPKQTEALLKADVIALKPKRRALLRAALAATRVRPLDADTASRLIDPRPGPAVEAEHREDMSRLYAALESLDPRERYVLERRFGLPGFFPAHVARTAPKRTGGRPRKQPA